MKLLFVKIGAWASRLFASKAVTAAENFAIDAGGGGLIRTILSAIGVVLKQLVLMVRDCFLNPRVWLALGLALLGGMALGRHFTWEQANADANTLRQEAEIWNAQADASASAATTAAHAAVEAEQAKIAAEKRADDIIAAAQAAEQDRYEQNNRDAAEAKAVEEAKAKPKAAPKRKKPPVTGDWFTSITGALKP